MTNPPFSLFRDYVALLMQYNKQFAIIGNQNAITYREIFPLIKSNKIWLGYNNGHYWFMVPDSYEEKKTDFKIDESGQKWRRMGNICWFTNLDIEKRHEDMTLFARIHRITIQSMTITMQSRSVKLPIFRVTTMVIWACQ